MRCQSHQRNRFRQCKPILQFRYFKHDSRRGHWDKRVPVSHCNTHLYCSGFLSHC
jgi:hypothetical protein